jgi:Tlde1 domain
MSFQECLPVLRSAISSVTVGSIIAVALMTTERLPKLRGPIKEAANVGEPVLLKGSRLVRSSIDFDAAFASIQAPHPGQIVEEVATAFTSALLPNEIGVRLSSPAETSEEQQPVFPENSQTQAQAQKLDAQVLADAADGHTAIYDISARAVFLPDGRKLEAHSGLGKFLDNPGSADRKNRGVTPPNVYVLALREHRFHKVQALRMIPLFEAQMHGRDGILAHSYLHGANGQSNGCVAFKTYPAFLDAFLSGKVNRLLVVANAAAERFPTQVAARR